MVTDIYMPVLPAILPLLILNNGYSYLAAGLLVTAYNVTSSFTQPVVGWLSDTKGLTVSVTVSLFVSAVFVALMGVAKDYYLIMAFAVIAALGHACFHPTALSLVSRLCTDADRGRITSYFVVGGNLGYAIGPVLAGVLVWSLGLPGLLLLIIPAVVMVFALRHLLPGGIAGACELHAKPALAPAEARSLKPFTILMTASILRAWGVFAAITFLPMYLVTQGYDLVYASAVMTLMLLAGVAGQVAGGRISDRIGRKEFMVFGLVGAIPCFYLFFATTGVLSVLAVLLFGFFLWSTFAVAVAMSHELLPGNVGLASGMMMGLAIGFGGLGVAVNGMIADHYSLAAALGTIPIPIAAAVVLMAVLPYPWKTLFCRNRETAIQ
ncbi:MAG: MFS transporter [Methanoregula sp.]|jgi:FSR family fosmidomycin resistance protein-like MFS transporter|uniref:MFS transporter n=1 Tax=Methanoregula sp. TaxID=2052170 RepID=UPI00344DCD59|nr:MFS transporter [Methanoregula sp.]